MAGGRAPIDIRIFGDKKLTRKFTQFERKFQRDFVRKGLRAAGKVIEREWKAQTPVDTGHYKRGLKVRAMKRSRTRIGYMVISPTRRELGIPDDAEFYYPAVIEFGGQTKDGRTIPAIAPGRKALASKQTEALNTARDVIWQRIRAMAAKG